MITPRGSSSAGVEKLAPGYFSLVMATGIVSLAAHFLQFHAVALALFWINVVAYGVLWVLTLARIARHARKVLDDLADHARGAGFFTWPAGTCVLGAQCVVLVERRDVALVLWFFGIALWAVVTYGFFAAITMKAKKPALADGLNATWLIAVVAMQSIAVLGCLLASGPSTPAWALFVATAMHLAGFMLYLPLIGLLIYRWTFVEITPQQMTPPYWINMGALAISTLAGSRLLQVANDLPLLTRMSPFLAGTTFFLWAAATWWIPLLVVLGFWRHVVRRVPFVYDPQYWGMVFPLGMYTVCTVQISRALELPQLMGVAKVFVWPALLAWLAVFVGMSRGLAMNLRRGR